MGLTIFFL